MIKNIIMSDDVWRQQNTSTIMYFNTVLDFPQYRLHKEFMKRVDRLALKQDNGDFVKMGGDGHVSTDMLVYDFTAPGMCDLFNSACLNATRTGMVDGCFLGTSV